MSSLGPGDVPFTDRQRDALLLEMHSALQRMDDRSAQSEMKLAALERAREQHSKDIAAFKADRERAKWWTRTIGGAAIVAFAGTVWGIITGKN